MKACGLIVEYNPLHNGHLHHINTAKKKSSADCMIAVMSGSFLQRGEPAIIDKFHRTKAALDTGVDIVIELPYLYAVQSSHLFARGAVQSLNEIGVQSICFGSESGKIEPLLTIHKLLNEHPDLYTHYIKDYLNTGLSYPKASALALKKIGHNIETIDITKPNNILGLSYIQTIIDLQLSIKPITIKRMHSDFHEDNITGSITSATSIRNALFDNGINEKIRTTMPDNSIQQLEQYQSTTQVWHEWEKYFAIIHYLVTTHTAQELSMFHGVDEGLQHRIKQTAKKALSFKHWMKLLKTKRYTWTRLQRMFVHILTRTKKTDVEMIETFQTIPYIRILGMTDKGRTYLNQYKKEINVPTVTQITRDIHPLLSIDERASDAYYSILTPEIRKQLKKQEITPPIII